MKNKKLLIVLSIIAAILICATVFVASAALSNDKAMTIMNAIVNGEDYSENNDLNGDKKVDVLDAILAIKDGYLEEPLLDTLTLDGGYSLSFVPSKSAYTVTLPAGRPRVPMVSATADSNYTVDIQQATLADSDTKGVAKISVSDGAKTNTYTINFVRPEVTDTVVLQYEDRYTFVPDYTLGTDEAFTFVSSDSTVVSVDENGQIVAKAVSSTPVTVTEKVGETEVDTLTVSEIHKAQVNLFLVTGQSNAQGCYDFDTSNANNITAEDQIKAVDMPEKQGTVYSYDVYPREADNPEAYAVKGTLYDMAVIPRQGFASALGKTYYNLSGEKVVFLQSAYSGSPIERWLDPDDHPSLAEADTNHYDATQTGYTALMAILTSDKYEIRTTANFWLQGETCMSSVWDYNGGTSGKGDWKSPGADDTLFTDEDYSNMFLKVHKQMQDDFGIETNNILLVRAHGSVVPNKDTNIKAAINNVRAAQYSLANTYDDITIVSRLSDWVVPYNTKYIGTPYEPYNGMMGVKNVHYNQIGHNANGVIAAENYFKNRDAETDSAATSVEIINTDGIERLSDGTTFTIEVGDTKRLAAFALPEHSLSDVEWTSSDPNVAKVSTFGLITVLSEGNATITATAESGVKATVKVVGVARTAETIHYRWDFNGNLSSSADANDLRLSDLATKNIAGGNYKFENGKLVVASSVAALNRPDFTMTFPVTVSSDLDWSIEWKAKFTNNSVFLGVDESPVSIGGKNKYPSHIYSVYKVTAANDTWPVAYPLRFNDSQGNEHFLSYTSAYGEMNKSLNTWKLEYKKQTGKLTLYVKINEVWTFVNAIEPGVFEATYNNVLGRYHSNGLANFTGEMDYIDIKVAPATFTEEAHYKWEFNDKYLESEYDSNQLTPTELSVTNSATASISGGKITINSSNQLKRMNYSLAETIVISRDYDWSIEWKASFLGGSLLLGNANGSSKGNLYNAFGTGVDGYNFGLRLNDDGGRYVTIPFASTLNEAKSLNNAENTWILEYISSTNTMSLKLYDSGSGTWTVIGTANPTTGQFQKATFTGLFGRFNEAGLVNFYGTMDYIEVKTMRSYKHTDVEYDWQFTDLTSSADQNTLTPTADSNYTLPDGIYTTTSRAGELMLENAITVDSTSSWTIEWRSNFADGKSSNSLFGTENCTNSAGKTGNSIYLAPGTYKDDFKSPVRISFGNTKDLFLEYVKGATNATPAKNLANAWNTWRLKYDKDTRTLSLELYDETNSTWNICDSAQPGGFSMTFTAIFGDFGSQTGGNNLVNMHGMVDYVKVNFVEREMLTK